MQIVVFELGKIQYAFDIRHVQEIIRKESAVKTPNMPVYMEGIINLRGKIIPVINLSLRFNILAEEESKDTRLIVINLSQDNFVAVVSDRVNEVLDVEESLIEVPPEFGDEKKEKCFKGIIKIKERLIILLDSSTLLQTEELPILGGECA